MKKNKMMRLASGLLVAVLLTTSMISGTYAKYVTTASADDTARVAKWGVEVSTDTALFAKQYATKAGNTFGYTGTYSVDATEDVVAPGTSGSMTFSIKGQPEVAVNVKVTLNDGGADALKMITLPGVTPDTYIDYTVAPYTTKFSNTEDYNPILWTLKKGGATLVDKKNLQAVETYFESISKNYNPNEPLDTTFGEYTLSWEWPYESGHDEADTYLGQVMSGKAVDSTVKTTEAFAFNITVTQID